MALLILTSDKQSIYNISKTELNARTVMGNFNHFQDKGLVKQITDQQFNDLNLNKKIFDYVDGDNVVLKDPVKLEGFGFKDKTQCDNAIKNILEVYPNILKAKAASFANNTQFKQDVENYIEFLKNFDTNSLTYPIDITFEEYLTNNSLTTPIHSLQF